ncbi:MAG: hypothetical protein Q8R28_11620, partial [Dehalococcoidia bacterium]|nr:hypothetical protein [Dehalococcoidia bacterium]
SNHFRDRDNPAEILSGKAHEEFIQHADKTGEYPELWLWHTPGSKVGTADWLDFADGFLLMSGSFDPDKADVAERLAKATDPLTMSHGFWRLKADAENVITHQYRMVEASICPQGVEANPWTRFTTAQKEAELLSPKKKEFLTKFLGAETVAAIEADTTALRKAAEEAGVDWKAVEALDGDLEPETEPAAAKTPAIDAKALAEQMVPALVEALGLKALSDTIETLRAGVDAIPALSEAVRALQADMLVVRATDDEKVAKTLAPRSNANALAWMTQAASKKDSTVLDPTKPEDVALAVTKPAMETFVDSLISSMNGGAGA